MQGQLRLPFFLAVEQIYRPGYRPWYRWFFGEVAVIVRGRLPGDGAELIV